MPTSAIGTWAVKAAGFTLLEVLVTLALIGIITGFAVLGLRAPDPVAGLATEAQRLAALLELNRQEAILLNRQRGLRVRARGYEFLQLDLEGAWQAVPADGVAFTRRLPTTMTLHVQVEGRPLLLDGTGEQPQVVLLASGEASEFAVTFSLAATPTLQASVSGDVLGRLAVRTAP